MAHRERAAQAFELMFRQSFERAPGGEEPSEIAVRAIVAGIRRVVYRCLRAGHPEQVGDHIDELLGWALSYQEPKNPTPRKLPQPIQAPPPSGLDTEVLEWSEPADSGRSRAALSQRERIVRAAAQVAADSGYPRLTIPAISAASGTSNQTFYEHFDGKEGAFLAAFDELARRALESTAAAAAGESDWQGAVNAGIRGLLEHLVEEPLFAQIAFFEIPTAGAAALDRADVVVRRFTAFLDPRAVPEGLAPLPPVVVEAIGGGMWGAIQHEIAAGRLGELPDKAPEIAAVALAPFALR